MATDLLFRNFDDEATGCGWYHLEEAGEPRATLCVTTGYTIPGEAEIGIWSVRTETEYQNQGYGRALMTHVCNTLRTHGYTKAALLSVHSAVGFYEKLGWQRIDDHNNWMTYTLTEVK